MAPFEAILALSRYPAATPEAIGHARRPKIAPPIHCLLESAWAIRRVRRRGLRGQDQAQRDRRNT
jgi:hypothetical protein